jgi:SOS-response transcriptional repressor LexA
LPRQASFSFVSSQERLAWRGNGFCPNPKIASFVDGEAVSIKPYEFIKKRRIELGLSQQALADLVGVSRAAVALWEKSPEDGGTFPTQKHVPALGAALQVARGKIDIRRSIGVAGPESLDHFRQIPHISLQTITASNMDQLVVKASEFLDYSGKVDDAFAVTVRDESMAPTYQLGDEVVARRSLYPQEGDIVVYALTDGPAVLRKYHVRGHARSGEEVYDLVAIDPETPTVTVRSREEGRIVGVAVEHRKKLRR